MRLAEYFRREGKGSKSALARKTGLAYTTVLFAESGMRNGKPWHITSETAKKIEKATNGEVTAAELLGVGAAKVVAA